jgi:hypothetical protein
MLGFRRNRHDVRAGDVFLYPKGATDGGPELFLVEEANTSVYLSGRGGHGHSGITVSQSKP